jgi:peptidoglycan-associated lipoprotein
MNMKRKVITGFIALAFVCFSSLIMASCAKKQVVSEAPTKAPAEKMKAPAYPEADKAVKMMQEEKEKMAEEEAAHGREAERQARMREMEASQRMSDEIAAFETKSIYFDFDKSNLLPEAMEILKDKAEWLRKNPSYKVRIEGNCDERGTNEYNLALGERRAHAAKKYLMALGVSGDRIMTISYGEERPAVYGHNEAAWAKNRRDDFRLIK